MKPMDCKAVDVIPKEDNLLYELKYDGFRTFITVNENSTVEIRHSDNPNILNYRYPLLVQEMALQPAGVYDGEICAFNEFGMSVRSNVQKRQCTNRRKIQLVSLRYPISFMIFDLLKDAQGNSIKLDSLIDRKAVLKQQLKPTTMIGLVSYQEKPDDLLKQEGLIEGIVIKGMYSVYEEGKRSGAWRKKRFTQEATIKVVKYTEYTRDGQPAGITCIADDGRRVNLPGKRADGAKKIINNIGYVTLEIEFYREVPGGYEFAHVKRVIDPKTNEEVHR